MGPRARYGQLEREEEELPTADPFRLRWTRVQGRTVPMKTVHRHCQNGDRCTGSGCVIRTGKSRR